MKIVNVRKLSKRAPNGRSQYVAVNDAGRVERGLRLFENVHPSGMRVLSVADRTGALSVQALDAVARKVHPNARLRGTDSQAGTRTYLIKP